MSMHGALLARLEMEGAVLTNGVGDGVGIGVGVGVGFGVGVGVGFGIAVGFVEAVGFGVAVALVLGAGDAVAGATEAMTTCVGAAEGTGVGGSVTKGDSQPPTGRVSTEAWRVSAAVGAQARSAPSSAR
jgi:hypothetical protein